MGMLYAVSPTFDDILKVVAASEQTMPEDKRSEFSRGVMRKMFETKRELIDWISKEANARMNEGHVRIMQTWKNVRADAERLEYRLVLRNPSTSADLEPAVMWAAERGDSEDLQALISLKSHPPSGVSGLGPLLDAAIMRLHERGFGADDAIVALREADTLYEQNSASWEREYAGRYIALYAGELIAASADKDDLERQLTAMQREMGPFRACIIEIGTGTETVRGPRVRLRGERPGSGA